MARRILWNQFEGRFIHNRFRLKQLIGAGSFGAVFMAEEPMAERLMKDTPPAAIAIKLVPFDPEHLEDQFRELMFATILQHPHLLRCFEAGRVVLDDSKFLWLGMEMAESSLRSRLAGGLVPPAEAAAIVGQLASALAFLDQQNLAHGDLKPANVLFAGGYWKISDFANVRRSQQLDTSEGAELVGSPDYMPPESVNGTVTPKWDIWALGITMLEMISGPVKLQSSADFRLHWQSLLNRKIAIPPDLPRPFDELAPICLAYDYKERANAAQVLDVLERHGYTAGATGPVAVQPTPLVAWLQQTMNTAVPYWSSGSGEADAASIANRIAFTGQQVAESRAAIAADTAQGRVPSAEARMTLARSLNSRGLLLRQVGWLIEALAAYEESISISQTPANDAAESDQFQQARAEALAGRGMAFSQQGLFEQAVASYDQSIVIYRTLVTGATANRKFRGDLASTLWERGLALGQLGQLVASFTALNESFGIRRSVMESDGADYRMAVQAILGLSPDGISHLNSREVEQLRVSARAALEDGKLVPDAADRTDAMRALLAITGVDIRKRAVAKA